MANEYLVEIHKYISEKIVSAQSLRDEANANNEMESFRFYEGQIEEWQHMRAYLAERVNLKTQKYF
jgi:hypothetical protein